MACAFAVINLNEQRSEVFHRTLRPEHEKLPVPFGGFDDGAGIATTYELGRRAGVAGFREYDPAPAAR